MLREEKILEAVKSITLKNGFKVIYTPNRNHPVVSMQLLVRMGSCWEKENEAGYSHFTEHLVFKSTNKYPDNELSVRASFLGSNINAYTEFDSTCFYLTLSSMFLKDGMDLLSQLVRHSNFSKGDFKVEKGVILEEINQYNNDPDEYFVERVPLMYFEQSPYKKPIIGTKESIQNSKYEELKEFYKKYYIPQNCFLVVSGDFEEDELLKYVDELFGDWIKGAEIEFADYKTVYPAKLSINSVVKKISKPVLAFALPELSDKDPNSHALGIITRIFAVGKKSRLHKRLYIKERLVEQIRVDSYTGSNSGISIIMVMPTDSANVEKIINIFLEEFDRIRHLGFSIDEFKEVKTELMHSHRYSLEYMQYLGMSLGSEELLGDYKTFIEYPNLINSVTESQLQEMVKQYYTFDKLGIYHLGKKFSLTSKIQKQVEILQERRIENGEIKANYYETQLENGTNILFKRMTGRPTIGITAAFPVSQLNERRKTRGVNFLTSTMLLYGNEKFSHEQMIEYCSKHGIQLDISTHEEITVLKIKCFPELLTTSLDLLAEIMLSSTFPQEHIENVRRTLISALERAKDYPAHYASYLWKKQLFGIESNLIDKEGGKTELKNISRKKMIEWFQNYYSISEMTLAIVGDFDFENTLYYCNRVFNQPAKPTTKIPADIILNPGKLYKVGELLDNQQTIIHLGGYATPAKETMKSTAFNVLSQIIGGDMNSRLFTELRENWGYAYSVGFDYLPLQDMGFYAVSALVDRNKWKHSLKIIREVLNDVSVNGVTDEELQIAKNTIRGNRLRSEESVLSQSTSLAMIKVLGYTYEYYLEREKRLLNVNRDDIEELAATYFTTDNTYIHILK
ncbi:MAG: pitrilysin family protein [Candidatus Cloacimonas sp.]|nr:insulinase family protein [Candidatus Cloacimonadota bacterium]